MEVLGYICIALVAGWIFLALFQPHQQYRVDAPATSLDTPEFRHLIQSVVAAPLREKNKITVFPNGENFYPAMLDAIKNARQSIDLEAYIFQKGETMNHFVAALTERAKAGVKVNVVLDGLGSLRTTSGDLKGFTEAGGTLQFYHPLRWYTWDRYNNRTHRELLIVDGKIGFIGGAGIGDHWWQGVRRRRYRRSLVARRGRQEALARHGRTGRRAGRSRDARHLC
jgi:cardiolipin synthase A/B